jgi:hypothetical protein
MSVKTGHAQTPIHRGVNSKEGTATSSRTNPISSRFSHGARRNACHERATPTTPAGSRNVGATHRAPGPESDRTRSGRPVSSSRIERAHVGRSTYSARVIEIGSRARTLPAPPSAVWDSLVEPRRPAARPWLHLPADEVDPRVLAAEKPGQVVWSSRPDDQAHFALTASRDGGTLLRFTLLNSRRSPRPEQGRTPSAKAQSTAVR